MQILKTYGAYKGRVLVDKDFVALRRYYITTRGYVADSAGGSLHRLVARAPKGMVVDHINGNPLDNRLCNLRVCSNKDNVRSRKRVSKLTKSGVIGVNLHRHTLRWVAYITVNYKNIHLGYFQSLDQAIAARSRAETHYFGGNIPRGCAALSVDEGAINIMRDRKNRSLGAANKSGFRGVHWSKPDSCWVAQICRHGIRRHIGCYKLLKDACTARLNAEKETE